MAVQRYAASCHRNEMGLRTGMTPTTELCCRLKRTVALEFSLSMAAHSNEMQSEISKS
jgi:hypothetical protein